MAEMKSHFDMTNKNMAVKYDEKIDDLYAEREEIFT